MQAKSEDRPPQLDLPHAYEEYLPTIDWAKRISAPLQMVPPEIQSSQGDTDEAAEVESVLRSTSVTSAETALPKHTPQEVKDLARFKDEYPLTESREKNEENARALASALSAYNASRREFDHIQDLVRKFERSPSLSVAVKWVRSEDLSTSDNLYRVGNNTINELEYIGPKCRQQAILEFIHFVCPGSIPPGEMIIEKDAGHYLKDIIAGRSIDTTDEQ